jgi:hypothetical protein
LITLTYGDEGESGLVIYRIEAPTRYEVLVELRPIPNQPSRPLEWQRYICTSIAFVDTPGFAVNNVPELGNSDCTMVQ